MERGDSMKLLKSIINFFKKILKKSNDIKMIESPKEYVNNSNQESFINSLKVNIPPKKKKKKIETLTCFGDGLGIQNKITY